MSYEPPPYRPKRPGPGDFTPVEPDEKPRRGLVIVGTIAVTVMGLLAIAALVLVAIVMTSH